MINLLVITTISTQFPIWPVSQSLLIVTNCLWRGLLPGEVPNSPHLVCCLGRNRFLLWPRPHRKFPRRQEDEAARSFLLIEPEAWCIQWPWKSAGPQLLQVKSLYFLDET